MNLLPHSGICHSTSLQMPFSHSLCLIILHSLGLLALQVCYSRTWHPLIVQLQLFTDEFELAVHVMAGLRCKSIECKGKKYHMHTHHIENAMLVSLYGLNSFMQGGQSGQRGCITVRLGTMGVWVMRCSLSLFMNLRHSDEFERSVGSKLACSSWSFNCRDRSSFKVPTYLDIRPMLMVRDITYGLIPNCARETYNTEHLKSLALPIQV